MAKEKAEVLPWGQHGVIRRKESGLTAQNHRMQDAGRSTILHMMFYVSWPTNYQLLRKFGGIGQQHCTLIFPHAFDKHPDQPGHGARCLSKVQT